MDTTFAKFIKKRDSDGVQFKCISCGQNKLIDQFNAGHYFSRGELSIRWNEKNVNGQCISCNKWKNGNIQDYQKGLIVKYGEGIIQELEIKKALSVKYARFEIEILIKHYKSQISNF